MSSNTEETLKMSARSRYIEEDDVETIQGWQLVSIVAPKDSIMQIRRVFKQRQEESHFFFELGDWRAQFGYVIVRILL